VQAKETTIGEQSANWRVTTSNRPTKSMVTKAEALAEKMGLRYSPRGGSSVQRFQREFPESGWLVIGAHETLLGITPAGQRMQWHLGLAKSRIAAAQQGQPDYLLQSLMPCPGERYFDGNLGMAHDALLVASTGASVVAMEIDPIVHAITESGLNSLRKSDGPLSDAAQRIEVLLGDHTHYLQSCETNSFDGVCFSPMFVDPHFRANDVEGLREIAHHHWLDPVALDQARRVSSKVVIKLERGCHPDVPQPSRWLGSPRRRLHFALYER
jgi:hypothetical protein